MAQLKNAASPISMGAQVAAVVELLEQILLGLADSDDKINLQTLLLAQRVSRGFRNTIIHSLGLQNALFFTYPTKNPDRFLNPLLSSPLHATDSTFFIPELASSDNKDALQVALQKTSASSRRRDKAQSWRRMYLCSGWYKVELVTVAEGDGYSGWFTDMVCPTIGQIVDKALTRPVGGWTN